MELSKAVHSLREMQQTASYSREDSHAAQASALQSPAYPVDTQAQERMFSVSSCWVSGFIVEMSTDVHAVIQLQRHHFIPKSFDIPSP